MRPALSLRLGQQLTLTPQLQQALRLLAMPAAELELELRAALDRNPMLCEGEAEICHAEFQRAGGRDGPVGDQVVEHAEAGAQVGLLRGRGRGHDGEVDGGLAGDGGWSLRAPLRDCVGDGPGGSAGGRLLARPVGRVGSGCSRGSLR